MVFFRGGEDTQIILKKLFLNSTIKNLVGSIKVIPTKAGSYQKPNFGWHYSINFIFKEQDLVSIKMDNHNIYLNGTNYPLSSQFSAKKFIGHF